MAAIAMIGGCFVLLGVGRGGDELTAPILAVYEADGVVFAEVAACGADRVRSFVIEGDGLLWAVVPTASAAKITTIRVFDVPAQWQLSANHGTVTTRNKLAAAGDYLAWIRTDRGDQAVIAFSRADLDRTDQDRFVTSRDGEETSVVMSREDFLDRARRYCAA